MDREARVKRSLAGRVTSRLFEPTEVDPLRFRRPGDIRLVFRYIVVVFHKYYFAITPHFAHLFPARSRK